MSINNTIWNNFVDKNLVADIILKNIVIKYINNLNLTTREIAIFNSNIQRVEEIMQTLAKNQ